MSQMVTQYSIEVKLHKLVHIIMSTYVMQRSQFHMWSTEAESNDSVLELVHAWKGSYFTMLSDHN